MLRPDLHSYCPASNLAFNEKILARQKTGEKIYHFGFGQSPFPIPEVFVENLKKNAWRSAYLPVAGLPELRDAIARMHAKYDGLDTITADDVIVGPGSKELIFLCLSVFEGDVLLISPSWTTYKPQVLLSRNVATVMETSLENNWRITPELIEQTIKQQGLGKRHMLLIMCNPDNPTGTAYDESHLIALTEVLRKHRITVISDEIYSRLHFNGQHKSLAKYYPEGTIISTGFSKWASAGGWRVGYHIYPGALAPLRSAVHCAASHTFTCAAAPMQYAVAETLNEFERECEDYIYHTKRILSAAGNFCCRELRSVGIKVNEPLGGYYLFPDFEAIRPALNARGVNTGDQMCDMILKDANVAIMAGGPAFLRPVNELTTRLCYINFEGKEALRASMATEKELGDDFIKEYCVPLWEGIQALKRWVKNMTDEGSKVAL